MRDKNTSPHSEDFSRILVSSRSLAEYRAMFSLTDADLTKEILDCPGGAAAFTGELSDLGGHVTACDIAYFDRTPADLAHIAIAEAARGNQFVHDNREQYAWTFFTDPDDHARTLSRGATQFSAHVNAHPERFVAGRLPSLPFADATFDLVLSSHLLFSYSETLDHEFHVSSITDLMRVARTELRISPLIAIGASTSYPRLDDLLDDLLQRGIVGRTERVDYEFQQGASEMLVCNRAMPGL